MDILLAILYFITFIFICIIWRKVRRSESNLTKVHFVIALLAIGDGVFNLARSFNQIKEIASSKSEFQQNGCFKDAVASIFENISKLFFNFSIFGFICLHHSLNHVRGGFRNLIKIIILVLISSSLVQFVLAIAQENNYEASQSQNPECFNASTNQTDIFTNFDNFSLILFPFAIEFRVCCCIELVIIFLTFENDHVVDEIGGLRNFTINRKLFFPLTLFLIIIVGYILFEFNNLKLNNFEQLAHSSIPITNITTTLEQGVILTSEIIQFLLTLILGIITVISLFRIGLPFFSIRNDINLFKEKSLEDKIDFGSLCVAWLIGICGYFIIQMIGLLGHSAHELNKEGELIKWTWGITLAVELITPLVTLFQLLQELRNNVCDTSLLMLNFSLWLFHTFSAKESRTNPFMIRAFGEKWHLLDPIFIPLAIFFHFHLFVIMVKKFRNVGH